MLNCDEFVSCVVARLRGQLLFYLLYVRLYDRWLLKTFELVEIRCAEFALSCGCRARVLGRAEQRSVGALPISALYRGSTGSFGVFPSVETSPFGAPWRPPTVLTPSL